MKWLMIQTQAPFESTLAEESLEMTLAIAAFNDPVQVLFSGSGVLQLKQDLDPISLLRKPFTQSLGALKYYDIEHVYAQAESLESYGLTASDLSIPVQTLTAGEIHDLFQTVDHILTF